MDFTIDVDRHCNEVESEIRCCIAFELTLATEFVLVNFHNGLEGVVLKIPDIPTISKSPCLTCKGPAAGGEALGFAAPPPKGEQGMMGSLCTVCRNACSRGTRLCRRTLQIRAQNPLLKPESNKTCKYFFNDFGNQAGTMISSPSTFSSKQRFQGSTETGSEHGSKKI